MSFVLSLLIVAVICYFGYQKIRELERDIRRVKEEKADKPNPVEIKPAPTKPAVAKKVPEKTATPKATKKTPEKKAPKPAETKPAAAAKKTAAKAVEPVKEAVVESDLEGRLLQQIAAQPGLKQTELYSLFPGEDRRGLQAILLQLDKAGKLRREKDKGSYLVYPA